MSKLLVGGGGAVLAHHFIKSSRETKRRSSTPLHFDDGISEAAFHELVLRSTQRIPRLQDVGVAGMTVFLTVRSNSGITTWNAELDFNDYGRLTGRCWISSENRDSPIPERVRGNIQEQIAQFKRHIAYGGYSQQVGQLTPPEPIHAQPTPGSFAPIPAPTARAAGPARPPAPGRAAGWKPDPKRAHEFRWWDGWAWTAHVADRGVPKYDPL